MTDLVNLSLGNAGLIGLLGYVVVFFGLILLMLVVMALGKVMMNSAAKTEAEAPVEKAAEPVPAKAAPAPGSAGELKLYDTDPKDAAMIMAIVADTLGKPLNELRFKSIREVKE